METLWLRDTKIKLDSITNKLIPSSDSIRNKLMPSWVEICRVKLDWVELDWAVLSLVEFKLTSYVEFKLPSYVEFKLPSYVEFTLPSSENILGRQ